MLMTAHKRCQREDAKTCILATTRKLKLASKQQLQMTKVFLQKAVVPRIAASSYLNTAPLIWSFERGSRRGKIELITDRAPSRCADALAKGEVDAALVPVIEYQRMAYVKIVPRVCVGSKKRVRSVVIVTNGKELNDVETVALDSSSRTSAGLVQIIFREFMKREPRYTEAAPDIDAMLQAHDAALIIGDPAMSFDAKQYRVFDLASVWHAYTNLGFVFAVWMVGGNLTTAKTEALKRIDWRAARDEGLAHAEEIITTYGHDIPLSRTELLTYLRENICYELDDKMLAGLELFYTLAHKHKLISAVRPLETFG